MKEFSVLFSLFWFYIGIKDVRKVGITANLDGHNLREGGGRGGGG
jgi:hypothetical protein